MIKPEWTYKDIILNIEAIKSEYQGTLLSFLLTEKKKKIKYMDKVKEELYKIHTKEWRKDMIWAYINGETKSIYYLKSKLDTKE